MIELRHLLLVLLMVWFLPSCSDDAPATTQPQSSDETTNDTLDDSSPDTGDVGDTTTDRGDSSPDMLADADDDSDADGGADDPEVVSDTSDGATDTGEAASSYTYMGGVVASAGIHRTDSRFYTLYGSIGCIAGCPTSLDNDDGYTLIGLQGGL